ncbi:ABC transporter ATP-binding protein, partial [Streptomyces sp. NPDC057757]|uniref:ABC transporter ATP-binding protein n=1 Tax=Streptomyces sp. NPDC057757 TaxID=3346241 RepID=UPI0036C69CB2
QWLKALQEQVGVTTVFVTHDQDEALSFSDRVAVMNRGKVHQIGTPHEIYENPADLFVADFVGTANILAATVTEADGKHARVRVDGIGAPLTIPHTDKRSGRVKICIRPENITVHRVGDTSPPAHALTARVENRAYLGDHYRYIIRIADTPVVVTTTRPVTDGELVVSLAPDDIRIFHEEATPNEENPHAPVQ